MESMLRLPLLIFELNSYFQFRANQTICVALDKHCSNKFSISIIFYTITDKFVQLRPIKFLAMLLGINFMCIVVLLLKRID